MTRSKYPRPRPGVPSYIEKIREAAFDLYLVAMDFPDCPTAESTGDWRTRLMLANETLVELVDDDGSVHGVGGNLLGLPPFELSTGMETDWFDECQTSEDYEFAAQVVLANVMRFVAWCNQECAAFVDALYPRIDEIPGGLRVRMAGLERDVEVSARELTFLSDLLKGEVRTTDNWRQAKTHLLREIPELRRYIFSARKHVYKLDPSMAGRIQLNSR